eukprot:TRINITY_DN2246_c0_g1_i1.p3 TRINITY_DN2246_c0_g1~~TRINITY_DN2246_c0_g1_i1.p3  ORF type:complete len:104 (+),score=30.67 TRINITY_DN2246_c0_g1_i1:179-490(+)
MPLAQKPVLIDPRVLISPPEEASLVVNQLTAATAQARTSLGLVGREQLGVLVSGLDARPAAVRRQQQRSSGGQLASQPDRQPTLLPADGLHTDTDRHGHHVPD